jgi:hypothetical protein
MTIRARWLGALCLAAVGFASPTVVQAGSRGVKDGANLLTTKDDDIAKINAQIEDVYRRYHADLLIETFSATPADRAADLKHLGERKFFPIWAEERALAADVRGIYILVCSAPRHVEIYVDEHLQETFDRRTRDKLRKTLERKLHSKPHDALSEAVALVHERLADKEDAAKRGGWLWIVWLILGILGVWLGIALARRFQGGKAVAPPSAVSTTALAGQSIYQAMSGETPAPEVTVRDDAPTLEYPGSEPKESSTEGTVHG